MVGVGRQDVFSCAGRHGRRGGDLRAIGLHDAAAVRFLLIADLYLIDGGFQSEESGGIGQGGSPLSGAGLGRHVGYAFLFAVIGLWQGGIQFVRSHGTDALVLEIDVCRCAQCLFQSVGTYQRCAAVILVHVAHFFGDFDPGIRLVQLLVTQFFGEDRVEVFGFQRLAGGWVQRWHGLVHHVGLYVVPILWNFVFRQDKSFCSFAHSG